MDLTELQSIWESLAESDPFWAILSVPELKGGKWDTQEFFRTGVSDVQNLVDSLGELWSAVGKESALDFGCGAGRLTQALTAHFGHCVGVDIAPSMIRLANSLNRYGDRCEYHQND